MSKPIRVVDLPQSTYVGKDNSILGLSELLKIAAGNPEARFRYVDRATEGKRTCRLLLQEPIQGLITTEPMREPLDCDAAAQLFLSAELMRQSHRHPKKAPNPDAVKGWEVHRTEMGDKLIVIVWAAWVTV